MITLEQYFGVWASLRSPEFEARATDLLSRVNSLLEDAARAGIQLRTNPVTASQVSGNTFGGIRPLTCPQGSPKSAHKQALAVDVYDAGNALDSWLTDTMLTKHGLYREHPSSTSGWCHLTTRTPPSGKTTFYP